MGTGNLAPTLGQIGLQAELGRAVLTALIATGPQVVIDLFLGLLVGVGSISEAGVFANAGITQPTLTTALATVDATTIQVVSFTANANYPASAIVG